MTEDLDEKLREECKEYEALARIRRINARRYNQAMNGEPGDPPAYLCEDCWLEDCQCNIMGNKSKGAPHV